TTLVLVALCAVGFTWRRLLSVLPVAIAALVLSMIPTITASLKVRFPASTKGRFTRFRLRAHTGVLHLIQPLARLWSRLVYSLTAWRIRRFPTLSFRSEEHTSELQSRRDLVCRLLLEKK